MDWACVPAAGCLPSYYFNDSIPCYISALYYHYSYSKCFANINVRAFPHDPRSWVSKNYSSCSSWCQQGWGGGGVWGGGNILQPTFLMEKNKIIKHPPPKKKISGSQMLTNNTCLSNCITTYPSLCAWTEMGFSKKMHNLQLCLLNREKPDFSGLSDWQISVSSCAFWGCLVKTLLINLSVD